jgi:hypothetical protein
MPGVLHRAIHDLILDHPELAVRLAMPGARPPPPITVAATELSPAALTPDLALLIGGPAPTHGLVVEVQGRRDPAKPWVWPAYVAMMRRRHKVPVDLLVITPRGSVARWAARPLHLTWAGTTLRPRVIGPAQLPVLLRPEEAAQDIELAMLAAVAHVSHPQRLQIARAALMAVQELQLEAAPRYTDIIRAVIGPLEEELDMSVLDRVYSKDTIAKLKAAIAEGEARGEARGEERGKAEGKFEGLLQGLVDSLRFAWQARFAPAPLPDELERALITAGPDALRRAQLVVFTADVPERALAGMRAALLAEAAGPRA